MARVEADNPQGQRWRAVVSALCITVAMILVPASVVAGWARIGLVDEDRFVQLFAPLAAEPVIQEAIIDRAAEAISAQINLEPVTDDLLQGLADLGLSPRAISGLELLRTGARSGLEAMVHNATAKVVQSEVFQDVWEQALRDAHRTLLVSANGGTESGALTIADDGTVSVQLSPIVEAVKAALTERGIGVAELIPNVSATIDIAQFDALVTVRVVYSLAVAVGTWLPVLTVVLAALGIAVARRRSTAFLGTGIGILLAGAALSVIFTVGNTVLLAAATPHGFSTQVLSLIFDRVTRTISDAAIALVTLGAVLAVLGWSRGRWAPARRVRRFVAELNTSIRFGIHVDNTGFGRALYRLRVLLRTLITLAATVTLWLLRPLGAGDVLGVFGIALLAWWLLEIFALRPASLDESETDTAVPS